LDSQELVRSTGQTQAQGERLFDLGFALAASLGADDVGEPEGLAALDGEEAVVAAVQVQGLDVQDQAAVGDGLQGRREQDAVGGG
jgi:hypothetical protein